MIAFIVSVAYSFSFGLFFTSQIEPCPRVQPTTEIRIQGATPQSPDSYWKMSHSSRMGSCTARNWLEAWGWIWLHLFGLSHVLLSWCLLFASTIRWKRYESQGSSIITCSVIVWTKRMNKSMKYYIINISSTSNEIQILTRRTTHELLQKH